MTSIKVWAYTGAATVALVVGALLATGSVSFAQSPTDTPAPSSGATTPPSDSSGGVTPAPSGTTPHDPANCPNMGTGSGTPGTSAYSHPMQPGAGSTTAFHGHPDFGGRTTTTRTRTSSGGA